MDELEKHILDRREEMDLHDPSPDLWNRIEKRLPRRKQSPARYLLRAAAVLVIAVAGMTAVYVITRTAERVNDPDVKAVKEAYYYYDSRIKSLYQEAQPLLTSNPEISTELTEGMNELDSLSAQIIDDLKDDIASSEVVEALIQNYRLRIELLEDMLRLMQENEIEIENEKQTGNEI
jgi:hypothetical protein